MDKLTLQRIELMHPKLVAETNKIYAEICEALKGKAICRFAYTLRTNAEQDALYAQGRTKLFDANGKRFGIVTNAKGGQSYHNYGLALDIVLIKDTNGDGKPETASWETTVDFDGDGTADWMEIVKIFDSYGWEWGGRWKFKDLPHFQKAFGKSIGELQKLPKDVKGYPIL
jgi:peptidoglycan L-alanyl-D-glutamate endopeptidase CwlK